MGESETASQGEEGRGGSGGAPGGRIGAYRLFTKIGEGGFGEVFEAEQTEPVRRRVALKVIKPGMDSASVVARFEAERQALAVMDHPCIAKVFDGGVTPAEMGSRPYFVMELVRGEAITEFCDRERLTIRQRCELMIRVCQAVQHAHNKGVIHRDLKPSNILVAYDGEGAAAPKVIDFGVAKALNQRLSEKTVFTERGQLIGTPEYMSPEQAEMSGLDIDTRTDVYALGVVLYELLTGVLPFDPGSLRSAGFVEIQRIIREVTPARPSTRLGTVLTEEGVGDAGSRIVESRHTDAKSLTSVLRRDLDWVAMKCLEKDRERRYETADGLAEELERYLRGEAVRAGSPSVRYRVGKYVRRHRAGVAVVCAGLVGLIGAVAVLGWLYQWAERERARAERMVEFLEGPALSPAALEGAGRNATMGEALRAMRDEVGVRFSGDPRTRARLLGAIGSSQVFLGEEEEAIESLDAVREFIGVGAALDHDWAWRASLSHAEALMRMRRAEESLALLDGLDAAAAGGGRRRGEWLVARGGALKWADRFDESEAAYTEAADVLGAALGVSHEATLNARYDLALVDLERGKAARAEGDEAAMEVAYRRALASMSEVVGAMKRSLGADARLTLIAMLEAGSLHSRLGEYEAAGAMLEEAIGGLTRVLGETHWRTLQARANLGSMWFRAEEYGRVIEINERVMEGYAGGGRLGSRNAFVTAKVLGAAHARLGAPGEGTAWLERVHAAASALGEASAVEPCDVAAQIASLLDEAGDGEGSARWRAACPDE